MAPSYGAPNATKTAPAHDGPFPGLTRSTTLPIDISSVGTTRTTRSRSHLSPEDAFHTASPPPPPPPPPPRRTKAFTTAAHVPNGSDLTRLRRLRPQMDSRSRSRRRKRSWKKILWVKQSYPDNYTDQTTFLDSLQRNPRLQPYDFWPLVADTTVIVQQVCSVTIFIVCFVGIFTERISPVAVVGWGSIATLIGWLLWDWWVGQEDEDEGLQRQNTHRIRGARQPRHPDGGHLSAAAYNPSAASSTTNLGAADRSPSQSHLAVMRQHPGGSATSLHSSTSQNSNARGDASDHHHHHHDGLKHRPSAPRKGGRNSLRLSTVKSALLILFTILGLSPILKSLTRSTSPDSIWAMSFWLLAINIFFFDYSGGVGVKFPASLSTNAALMASTVLASRLPSTGQVFSLTLFSIEVFGLFPVFRRYARHRSWRYHVALSVLLVVGAGGGVGVILGEKREEAWPWKNALLGVFVGALIAVVGMGASSWWLIGLQKYKNAMNGPWDQARPIIISRRQWDDE